MAWKTMKSAPKDGTQILVFVGEMVHKVSWAFYRYDMFGDFVCGWVICDDGTSRSELPPPSRVLSVDPELWLPLPRPSPERVALWRSGKKPVALMPFGRYKGRRVDELPHRDLRHLITNRPMAIAHNRGLKCEIENALSIPNEASEVDLVES